MTVAQSCSNVVGSGVDELGKTGRSTSACAVEIVVISQERIVERDTVDALAVIPSAARSSDRMAAGGAV